MQTQLNGQTQLPEREVAHARRWKRNETRAREMTQMRADADEVAELNATPVSFTLQTLGNGQVRDTPL